MTNFANSRGVPRLARARSFRSSAVVDRSDLSERGA
jgi:hypothetical protein